MFEGLEMSQLPQVIEAMLFITDEPLATKTIAEKLDVGVRDVRQALEQLQSDLAESKRGIQLYELAGGWRLMTHPVYHEFLQHYVASFDTRRLSQAALEVLAIVAYIQPTTRSQINDIRGVASDGPLNTLIERGYVQESGSLDTPGNPALYATTASFLERYGLSSIHELPSLDDFAPDEKTKKLIQDRLGLSSFSMPENVNDIKEHEIPSPEVLAEQASASVFGVVEKIDFDSFSFNTDDE